MIQQMRSQIGIVTVTYNSSHLLFRLLNSVADNVPVIVVDNGSQDINKTEQIVNDFSATLIRNERNIGFGQACNLGAKRLDSNLIFFVNPDVILLDDTIESLIKAASRFPNASAFNPAIKNSAGTPYFRRSSVISPKIKNMPKEWPGKDCEVVVLSGSALVVRTDYFNSIGGFDPKIFLYHEDDDLSIRLQKHCGPLMFIKSAQIIHDAGTSSSLSPNTAWEKGRHMGYSRVYTSIKHGDKLGFERALLSAIGEMCIIPRLFSKYKRLKTMGYFIGVLKARKFKFTK